LNIFYAQEVRMLDMYAPSRSCPSS
jgi:hypothetical protein